jgi:hypothetical protein
MTIDKIKDISLVEYLTDLGYQSHKKIGSNYWFLSPLHKEENPSFKVNSSTNLWYDFALARGGNIINLVQLLNPDMTMHQVLVALSNYSETNQSPQQSYQPLSDQRISHEDDTKIDCIKPITNCYLLAYIYSRNINVNVALKYCQEVHYTLASGKTYYGIAFFNMCGGMEVRNKYAKRCIGGKDISLILQTAGQQTMECCVFEGFFDFLAYVTAQLKHDEQLTLPYAMDCIILNSVSNVRKALEVLNDYDTIYCYLDNDTAGRKATEKLKVALNREVRDQSARYRDYNDVNDYLSKHSK